MEKKISLPFVNWFVSQPTSKGTLNILYAALYDDIKGGVFTGPSGKGKVKGPPTKKYHCLIGHTNRSWVESFLNFQKN